ncbi:MAG: hypothetical protein ABIQ39_05895 [Ilumatobacteraceae bacterium]
MTTPTTPAPAPRYCGLCDKKLYKHNQTNLCADCKRVARRM